jgi:hypothetical protein
MIKGSKHINRESILQNTTELDILREFWPSNREFALGISIRSPFRDDHNPSFLVGYGNNGRIIYKDFGDGNYNGDVWNFVKQMENIYEEDKLLERVIKRMSIKSGQLIREYTDIKKEETHHYSIIQVVTRPWNIDEVNYWNSYGLDISEVKAENIYVPKSIFVNKKRVVPKGLTFCYYYPDIEKWKIYSPLSPYKWLTNIPAKYVDHINDITPSKKGFIIKSKKDRMVVKKATGINELAVVHNEDKSCISEETLTIFNTLPTQKIVISDNDNKGKEFSWWLTQNHGFQHLNLPDKFKEAYGWTDFADLARGESLESVSKYFKEKGII